MTDPIERLDALVALEEFRKGIFHDENLRRDNKHDWEAAYTLGKLHDEIYAIPRAEEKTARQIVRHNAWMGEVHTCSKCKKIVPFIDWCQPYCSGCGARFTNYQRWCRKEETEGGNASR